jgi:hypothetical protein
MLVVNAYDEFHADLDLPIQYLMPYTVEKLLGGD